MEAGKISKVFKWVAAAGMLICALLKWLNIMPNASMQEIIMLWCAVYGVGAGTIDLNIMLDKFAKNPHGEVQRSEER